MVVTVKERNAGSFVFGLGYSQNAGIVTSIQLSQNNFLGTGNRFSIGLQNNSYSKSINFAYLDPVLHRRRRQRRLQPELQRLRQLDHDHGALRFRQRGRRGRVRHSAVREHDRVHRASASSATRSRPTTARRRREVIDYLVGTLGDRERHGGVELRRAATTTATRARRPTTTMAIPGPGSGLRRPRLLPRVGRQCLDGARRLGAATRATTT